MKVLTDDGSFKELDTLVISVLVLHDTRAIVAARGRRPAAIFRPKMSAVAELGEICV
jgi:hypothetical protein